ncbi:MAG: hypothetical protein ISP92_01460 [Pseudomonadales bacterium]|nr:hypothetical protein [Pseudomonadales bacterium]
MSTAPLDTFITATIFRATLFEATILLYANLTAQQQSCFTATLILTFLAHPFT